MKSFNISLLVLLMTVGMISTFISCNKDDDSGTPTISYVRVTRPESSDSLLVGAGQGQLIAIVGDNLQNAVQIWFNDQQSRLTPTYISKNSILVSVPTQIPLTVTNKLKIIFKNGHELLYNFQVQISKPLVTSMTSEFANEGDKAIINGNYFYAPLTVTFTGGVTGTIATRKDQQLEVQVPAGAQPGPITIKTNFGEVTSTFWFRDNRNLIIDGEHFKTGGAPEGWWGTYLITNPDPSNGDPPKISGNYYRFKKQVKAWAWEQPEVAGGPISDMPAHNKSIPDDAILNPANYNVKFEINTLKPYNKSRVILNVGLTAQDNDAYIWQPPYDSKGQWNTITIPFQDMVAAYANKPVVSSSGYWTRILIFGGDDFDADIAFDNLRIVPKK
ncbi:MAG TPA: glycan-binding surface protein [Chitinophagaceae bacterium]|nr:glycan-binding surface protein [Chitinophagaceae bacterium]